MGPPGGDFFGRRIGPGGWYLTYPGDQLKLTFSYTSIIRVKFFGFTFLRRESKLDVPFMTLWPAIPAVLFVIIEM